ncbi:MAG: SIS domain-containing protein [Syntrophobacter sp.]
MNSFALNYIQVLRRNLLEIDIDRIHRISELILNVHRNGNQVFIMGNGGSASTASHFACDLTKCSPPNGGRRLRVMSLNDNTPILTAWANDVGYDAVFREQLTNYLLPDDVVIAITASGNSPNVLNAVEYARTVGAISIGLIGFTGGKLQHMVDECVIVDNDNYGQVEDIHMMLSHMIAQYVGKMMQDGG